MKLKDILIINSTIIFGISYAMTRSILSYVLFLLLVILSFYVYYVREGLKNEKK